MATWTIRTHYKKSCEQREFFYQREGDGKIISTDGFRRCEYTIETTDDEFPDIQFQEMPNGDGKKDSIDLNSLIGDNIDNTELVEMFDGGCWGDVEIEGIDDDDVNKRNVIGNDQATMWNIFVVGHCDRETELSINSLGQLSALGINSITG